MISVNTWQYCRGSDVRPAFRRPPSRGSREHIAACASHVDGSCAFLRLPLGVRASRFINFAPLYSSSPDCVRRLFSFGGLCSFAARGRRRPLFFSSVAVETQDALMLLRSVEDRSAVCAPLSLFPPTRSSRVQQCVRKFAPDNRGWPALPGNPLCPGREVGHVLFAALVGQWKRRLFSFSIFHSSYADGDLPYYFGFVHPYKFRGCCVEWSTLALAGLATYCHL